MEESIYTESDRLKSKMKEWTASHGRLPIDEMKKFKASVESMPMVSFVNQRSKILEQANKLSSIDIKKFIDAQDPYYAQGEFVFENY